MNGIPDGTRFVLPRQGGLRHRVLEELRNLYLAWGYQQVEVPALEIYDPSHPRANQSFKLSDRDNGVLALRSDFTPALAHLVGTHFPRAAAGEAAVRLQYAGTVWHAIDPDLARTREFTQVGLELAGVSNARADAELIHLARESVRTVGLTPRVEVGNPGFVRALFDLAGVPGRSRGPVADAIDRKDQATLVSLLELLELPSQMVRSLTRVPDLYGDLEVLASARELAPWPETLREVERLEAIVAEFEDPSELLLDLGMARRLSYYTGMTFRAYTFDFGQPLLGGGRYDGALLPAAAGFSLGLERLLTALPEPGEPAPPLVVSLDDAGARLLRKAGIEVVRALESDPDAARREAEELGAHYLLAHELLPLAGERGMLDELNAILEGDR
ncbi:MAG TPA: ATP phosphoribosyltransferase regulatory subunit [Trueperaceae bacterium]